MKYFFKQPFQLISHGKDNEIEYIDIPAPTARVIECSILQVEVNKAFKYMMDNRDSFNAEKEEVSNKDQENLSKEDEIWYMLAICNVDVQKCYAALKQCIVKSKSMLNSEIRCSDSIYDEIPYTELKGLLGDYIVNFIHFLQ